MSDQFLIDSKNIKTNFFNKHKKEKTNSVVDLTAKRRKTSQKVLK